MTIIMTVLRSGGEYRPEHVQALHEQFCDVPSVCLSDVPVPGVSVLQQRFRWPGWFSKMELFNPDLIDDDILYFDLDTLLLCNPSVYMNDNRFRMLSDFYHPEKPASGMMFIPHEEKAHIWSQWVASPERWMRECRGDQDVLERICGRDVARFGERVKSWKVHVAAPSMPGYHNVRSKGDGSIPANTDVLCFHGNVRPWDVLALLPEYIHPISYLSA